MSARTDHGDDLGLAQDLAQVVVGVIVVIHLGLNDPANAARASR
jgi:hypothetical protein